MLIEDFELLSFEQPCTCHDQLDHCGSSHVIFMVENLLVSELLHGALLGPWLRNDNFDDDFKIDPTHQEGRTLSYQHMLIITADTTPIPSISDDIQSDRHRQAAFLRRIFQRTPAAPALLQSVNLRGLNVLYRTLLSEFEYLASLVSYSVVKIRDFEVF